jgi:hypothetical protein
MSISKLSITLFLAIVALSEAYLPLPISADLTGNGREELILYDATRSRWMAIDIDGHSILDNFEFGESGGVPLVGRFAGDSHAQLGMYYPRRGEWVFLDDARSESRAEISLQVDPYYKPLVGQFGRPGRDDLALFDAETQTWKAWDHQGNIIFENLKFGWEGLLFAAGDVTGNGLSELIAYDEARSMWMIISPSDPNNIRQWSWLYDYGTPVVRDYTGDGIAELGLWTNDGQLHVLNGNSGEMVLAGAQFGDYYALPVPGAYEKGPRVNLSYYSVGRGVWHVRLHDGRALSPTHPNEYDFTELRVQESEKND